MTVCLPQVLALVGLRCTGKSTVGARIAAAVGAEFIDLDQRIAAACGAPDAGRVIEERGIEAFRAAEERELAAGLVRRGPSRVVLATGGGAVESAVSRGRLARDAFTVWLRAPLAELVRRMEADTVSRPRLVGAGRLDEFRQLEARRSPLYREVARRAFDVDGLAPDEIAAAIERAWLG